MKSTAAFIVGTGVGYVLGARAGRQRFDAITSWTRSAWQSPQVQSRVTELEAKAADFARSEGAAIKGRVTENLRSTVRSSRGGSGRPSYPVTPTGDPATGGGASTADGAPFTTPPGATNGTVDGPSPGGTGRV